MEFHLFLYVLNWILLFHTITQEHKIWLPHYFTKDGIPSLPSCCKLDTSFSQMGRVKIQYYGCSCKNPGKQDEILSFPLCCKLDNSFSNIQSVSDKLGHQL